MSNTNTPEQDYTPFGKEWEAEFLKWSKKDIINFLRIQLINQATPSVKPLTDEDIEKHFSKQSNQYELVDNLHRIEGAKYSRDHYEGKTDKDINERGIEIGI